MGERPMTPAEFARRNGYVYATLWSGKLTACKVEGEWQIPSSVLERRKSREEVSKPA